MPAVEGLRAWLSQQPSRKPGFWAFIEDEEPVGRDGLLPPVDRPADVDESLDLRLGGQLEADVECESALQRRALEQEPVGVHLVREDADVRMLSLYAIDGA